MQPAARGTLLSLLLAAASLGGCFLPVEPTEDARIDPTRISVTDAPTRAPYGGTILVTWQVAHHTVAGIDTEVRFGPTSRAAGDLGDDAYPYAARPVGATRAPGTFQALVPTNLSTLHYRAYAEVQGVPYWSREIAVDVVGAPYGEPHVRLSAPLNATAGDVVTLAWSVENASGGVTGLNLDGTTRWRPVNASVGAYTEDVVFPYPGRWAVGATLRLSGSVVAHATAGVDVTEPVEPAVTFVTPPAAVRPEEEVELRWRLHGPVAADTAEVTVDGVTKVGAVVDGRNFTARVLAPLSGHLTAVARAAANGTTVESATLQVPVVATSGPHAIHLVGFPAEATAGGHARVTFQVQGPDANSTHLLVHTGNVSVLKPADVLSPTDYGGITLHPDGHTVGGPFSLPGSFTVTVPLPTQPGLLYLRAVLKVGDATYWSEEAEILVVKG